MSKVNELLEKYYKKLKPGSVLDLGSGDGTNIAWLRENGFVVTGVEKNYGMKIEDLVSQKDLKLIYDNVICFFTLHFLDGKALETISYMKQHIPSGGLNMITAFTTDVTWKKDLGFYFKQNELKGLYSNWKVIYYEEKPVKTYNGSNQMCAYLVAKKP